MKSNKRNRNRSEAFTLVEMLVVIAIIGILAGILLPTIAAVRERARVAQAKLEMGQIENAIIAYQTEYGRMPLSPTAAQSLDFVTRFDFTYGTAGAGGYGVVTNSPGGNVAVYNVNNSELMAVLMDMTAFRDGSTTVNANHARNPKKIAFLDAKQVDGPRPGLDEHGVYRDPWGQPYFITIDGDGDGKVYDGFYRNRSVSQQNLQKGYDGVFNAIDINGNGNHFAISKKVAVWSFGPDGKAALLNDSNTAIKSDGEGPVGGIKVKNIDNVLSWK